MPLIIGRGGGGIGDNDQQWRFVNTSDRPPLPSPPQRPTLVKSKSFQPSAHGSVTKRSSRNPSRRFLSFNRIRRRRTVLPNECVGGILLAYDIMTLRIVELLVLHISKWSNTGDY